MKDSLKRVGRRDVPTHIDPLDLISLEDAIRVLTPMQQEIVRMYFYEDRPLEEIGKILGPKYRDKNLTGSAIRYYLNQIIERLRETLDIQ